MRLIAAMIAKVLMLILQKKQYSNTINELELAIRGLDSKFRKAVIRNQEVESEVQDFEDKKRDWWDFGCSL